MSFSRASSNSPALSPVNEHRDGPCYPISPKEQLAVMPSDLLQGEVEAVVALEEDAGVDVEVPLQQHLESSRQRRRLRSAD
jgi:hypothetical protein